VLVFPGAFDPPHIGHKLLLAHAFFRSTYPNVIAAIIKATDKHGLECIEPFATRDTYSREYNQRARLWQHLYFHGAKYWKAKYCKEFEEVFSHTVVTGFNGYDVEFVFVGGSEYMSHETGCNFWKGKDMEKTIVGDFFRPGPHIGEDRVPKKLEACTEWKRDASADENLLQRIDQKEWWYVDSVLQLLYPG
jgi:hypothetical protein